MVLIFSSRYSYCVFCTPVCNFKTGESDHDDHDDETTIKVIKIYCVISRALSLTLKISYFLVDAFKWLSL